MDLKKRNTLMKKLIANILLVSSAAMMGTLPVHAQSDNAVTWLLNGFGYDGLTGDTLELDINFGSRFAAANGIVAFTNGVAIAVTGTCFITLSERAICDLALLNASITIDISLNTLDGDVDVVDQNSNLIAAGTVQLLDIE
jgi:hypothetical protein